MVNLHCNLEISAKVFLRLLQLVFREVGEEVSNRRVLVWQVLLHRFLRILEMFPAAEKVVGLAHQDATPHASSRAFLPSDMPATLADHVDSRVHCSDHD